MKFFTIVFLILVFFTPCSSQTFLSLKEAVEIGLENNYDIKLSANNLAISKENVTYGNAGILPTVTGNFNRNNNIQNSTQTQQNGDVRSLDNAKNNSMTYGVSVGWTVFDGLGMFSRYEKFQELQKQGDLALKSTVLQRVSDIITTYYMIVEQQNLLDAIDSSIVLSRERLKTAENRFSIGKASKLEVLNVQVNLNSDESTRLRQLETINNLKIALNGLLVRDLSIDFSVERAVNIDESLQLETLISQAKEHNPDLLSISLSKRIAELELKNVKASRYPVVRLNAGYNFSETVSSLGFVAQSNSRGLNYGLTASINIFDGFNQRRNERIAKINIDNSQLLHDKQLQLLETSLTQAYQTYRTNLGLSSIEQHNEKIAKQNLNITLEKFKIGTISTVEFRDAQENYINAISRLNAAKLQAKLSEIQLKELVGHLDFQQ